MMGDVNLSLSVTKRFWFGPAFTSLAVMCTLSSLISERLAGVISELGTTFLSRFGMVFSVEGWGGD